LLKFLNIVGNRLVQFASKAYIYIKALIETAFKGTALQFKFRLLLCAFFALFILFLSRISAPKSIRLPFVRFANRAANGTLLKIDQVYFKLTDIGAFGILIPTSEIWFNMIRPSEDEVFLDVGANIGKYSLGLARQFEKVISIEANPATFKILEEGIRMNKLSNVTAVNIAAWDSDKEIIFYNGEVSGYHSAIFNHGMGSIKVPARRLDRLLTDLKIQRLDWVKVDIEGAELEALRGLGYFIDKFRPKIIFEDFSGKAVDFLKSKGYSIRALGQYDFIAVH
jgi:FkbM family methyltransferase